MLMRRQIDKSFNNHLILLLCDFKHFQIPRKVGVRHVSLANNHIQDFRDIQTNKTTEYLRHYGINYAGIVYGEDGYGEQVRMCHSLQKLY